jgi:hypothetical protein
MSELDLRPSDERAHPPGTEPYWGESWYFDFVSADGTLGGYVRLGLYPNLGRAWYWACLVGEGRGLTTVIDHHVPLPAPGSLEVRSDGLWADHTVEAAFDHVSLGCEAFGVEVDDPAEVYGSLRGARMPLGLDLEWETVGPGAYPYPGTTRYEIPCTVHGEVLVGDERIELDGTGQRDHSWGVRDWWQFDWLWTAGALEDGTRFHTADIRIPGMEAYAPGYVQEPGGTREQIASCSSSEERGQHGFPDRATVECGDLHLEVEPLAFAPVLLTADDGARTSRFPRALCRFTAADGRTGTGWTEWNQVQR